MSVCPLFSDSATLAAKEAMRDDAKDSGLSRAELCDRLGECGISMTVSVLDAYLSDAHRNRFPAAWLTAWKQVTGQRRLYDLAMDEDDRRMLEIGRAYLKVSRIAGGAA